MVQAGTPRPVGHVDIGQERDDELGALDRIVGGCNMQRSLPVLVASIDIGLVPQQHFHRLLLPTITHNYVTRCIITQSSVL